MTNIIIQFSQLEAFVAENPPGIVRVKTLDVTESVSEKIPGLRLAAIGLHVRTINNAGHILACALPVARLQLFNGRRDSDPAWGQYDEAWERAEALQERALAYLTNMGLTVKAAGIIDTGKAQIIYGTWRSDPARSGANPPP